jgi:hypothetical protein
MTPWIIATALGVAVCAALWHFLPRHGDPRRTLAQLAILGLYRWARWWQAIAVGCDRGYLEYREEMRSPICSVNERDGAAVEEMLR